MFLTISFCVLLVTICNALPSLFHPQIATDLNERLSEDIGLAVQPDNTLNKAGYAQTDPAADGFTSQADNDLRSLDGSYKQRSKRGIRSWVGVLKARWVTSMMKGNYKRRNMLLKDAKQIDVEGNTYTWLKTGGQAKYMEDIDLIASLYKEVTRLDGEVKVIIKSLNQQGDIIKDIIIYSKKDTK